MKLTRVFDKPILTPSARWWESTNVFNPGAAVYQGRVILLYRAKGNDYISRFGKAVSDDGVVFQRQEEPCFEGDSTNQFERLGVEDPRITQIGDEYLIFYTGASVYPLEQAKDSKAPSLSKKAPWRIRTFLTKTKDFEKFSHEELELNFDSKDTTLFPEKINNMYVLLHRVYPDMYITYSKDLKHWTNHKKILSPREGFWDCERVGAGAPPIKTEKGWIHFYHGVDQNHVYRLGVLLHKLDNPEKILYRSDVAILEPEETWERNGYVSNVVFSCGVIEREDKYFVYYGAADKVIGLATINKAELLKDL